MKNCLQCGKEIELVNDASKYKKFCNRSCAAKFNNSKREVKPEWFDSIRTGKKYRKYLKCQVCHKDLDPFEHKGNVKFCNFECKKLNKENKKEKYI